MRRMHGFSSRDCWSTVLIFDGSRAPSNPLSSRIPAGMFSHRCIVLMVFLSCTAGCGQRSEVREYVVDREDSQVFTSDVIRDRFQAAPFAWEVPETWDFADNDQFSKFAWTVGPSKKTRITISDLSGSAGLVAQFVRWSGQVGLEAGDPAELMKLVEPLELKGASGQWIELKGASETILGMIVPSGDKLWIVKLRSGNSEVAAVKDSFRRFCESWQAI